MSITPPKLPAHSSGGAWYDGGAGRSLAAIRWADRILLKHSIHVSTVCLLVFLGASQLLAQEEEVFTSTFNQKWLDAVVSIEVVEGSIN